MPTKPKPKASSPQQFGEIAGDALVGLGRSLSQRANELERARTEEDTRRQELESRLQEQDADRPMLSVADWLSNEYYVGSLAAPVGQGGMFPRLRQDMIDIFEGDEASGGEPYFEIVIGGSQGWGKSVLAQAIGKRCLYELSCLSVPQFSVGRSMTRNAQILFLNYNVNEKSARATIFKELKHDLRTIPYFVKEFPIKPQFEKQIVLPKNITWRPGTADARGAVSENLLFVILDECNEYELVEESLRMHDHGIFDAAEELYQRCYDRITNRFLLPGGRFPRTAKLISVSQAMYPDDFIERRKKVAAKSDRPVKVLWYSEWDTHPHTEYVLGWFYCAVAPKGKKHKIYEDEQVGHEKAEQWRLEMESKGYDVRRVPREYVQRFRDHIEKAIRTYIGIATETIRPFLRRREMIQAAVQERQHVCSAGGYSERLMEHPFSEETTTLKDGGAFVKEALCRFDAERRRWYPQVNPRAARFAHFDLSKNKDRTGFVVGHVFDRREINRLAKQKGATEMTAELAPLIWVDVKLRIRAPRGESVDLADARSLVRELGALGFRFGHISYDQALSEDSQQRLREEGYDVGLLSVDRTTGPYYALRRALYERRLYFYDYEPLKGELLKLEENLELGKVDHPPSGKKDISDALAAVVWHCETLGMQGAAVEDEAARDALMPKIEQPYTTRHARQRRRGIPPGALPKEVLDIYLGSSRVAPPKKRKERASPTIWTRTYGRQED